MFTNLIAFNLTCAHGDRNDSHHKHTKRRKSSTPCRPGAGVGVAESRWTACHAVVSALSYRCAGTGVRFPLAGAVMAYIYGTVAGLLAVALEALYTRTPSYVDRLWIIVPTSLAISWCIYQLVRASPSIVSAVVVFTAVTLPARVGFALWLGQAIGAGTWMACGLLVIAAGLRAWRP